MENTLHSIAKRRILEIDRRNRRILEHVNPMANDDISFDDIGELLGAMTHRELVSMVFLIACKTEEIREDIKDYFEEVAENILRSFTETCTLNLALIVQRSL